MYSDFYILHIYIWFLQVVERVSVFVTDANDEKPEFFNLPFIVDVSEVSTILGVMSRIWSTYDECFNTSCVCVKGHRGGQKHLQSSSCGQRPRVRRKCHLLLTGQKYNKKSPSCLSITPRVLMSGEDKDQIHSRTVSIMWFSRIKFQWHLGLASLVFVFGCLCYRHSQTQSSEVRRWTFH